MFLYGLSTKSTLTKKHFSAIVLQQSITYSKDPVCVWRRRECPLLHSQYRRRTHRGSLLFQNEDCGILDKYYFLTDGLRYSMIISINFSLSLNRMGRRKKNNQAEAVRRVSAAKTRSKNAAKREKKEKTAGVALHDMMHGRKA